MYQRRYARYPVHFQSMLSSQQMPESKGTAVNLSIRGCGIQSYMSCIPGMRVRLSVEISESEAAIEIEQAVVRWASGQEFGVEFVTITPEHFERLTKLIEGFPQVPHRD